MPNRVRLHWKAFSVVKLGNRPEENEDAFWPTDLKKYIRTKPAFQCALSDGATSASFSALWAKLLVRMVHSFVPRTLPHAIKVAQSQWYQCIPWDTLPWFAEEKAKKGAFASFLSFRIRSNFGRKQGTFDALAVGDSCLVQTRGDDLITAFPIKRASDFGNHPILISSLPQQNSGILEKMDETRLNGVWERGDEFFLMTDALAAWFLQSVEAGSQPVVTLHQHVLDVSNGQDAFRIWVAELREVGQIKNDDTTLIWVRCP